MRLLKHIINWTLWSLLGLTVVLFTLIQLAPVQRWLGQRVADAIGSKLGMFTMDQLIMEKYQAGQLTYEAARVQMSDSAKIAELDRIYAVAEAQKLKNK